VVKLSVRDLPPKDKDGRKVIWINNFGVMDASRKYVKSVRYTVFLRARKNMRFVYYEHGRLKADKTPRYKGSKPSRSKMVQVDFNTGDPGVGCR